MTSLSARPPTIPGSLSLKTLEVDTAKITTLLGPLVANLNSWKGSVKAASTANLTLSGAQTVDGVALVTGDTILVKDQTNGIENGLYIVNYLAWTRAADLTTGSYAAGIAVFVNEGTLNKDKVFVCTNDHILVTPALPAVPYYTDEVETAILVFATLAVKQNVGTATLVAGTVTVASTSITASSLVFLSVNTPSVAVNGSSYSAPTASIVASTSFVINAMTNGLLINTDVSTINYMIVN